MFRGMNGLSIVHPRTYSGKPLSTALLLPNGTTCTQGAAMKVRTELRSQDAGKAACVQLPTVTQCDT